MSSKSFEHKLNHSQVDEGLRSAWVLFIILSEPPALGNPGQGALHEPRSGHHSETTASGPLQHFQHAVELLQDPLEQQVSLIGPVAPDEPQPMEPASPELEPAQQRRQSLSVSDIGGSHDHCQQQAHAVHQHMALAPFDPLITVKASGPVGEAPQRHRLRIDDGHAGRLGALAVQPHPRRAGSGECAAKAGSPTAACARGSRPATHTEWPRPQPAGWSCRAVPTGNQPRNRPRVSPTVSRSAAWGSWGGSFHGLSSLFFGETAYAMEAL